MMLWSTVLLSGVLYSTSVAVGEKLRRDLLNKGGPILYVSVDKCSYPCTCPSSIEVCDGCEECPGQLGEPCSQARPCDLQRGLICRYLHGDSEGVCRESSGVPCVVYNRTYEHGETFSLDCRTQCACQNGTYGCSSLCPQEHISPKGTCRRPRLVDVPGQCCREWMCDGQAVEQPPACQPAFSRWSICSSDCGGGVSSRRSNINARCEPETETRICQIRRCDDDPPPLLYRKSQHHLRRGHECKATHRLSTPVNLRFGPCKSRKRFRPKYCGLCLVPGIICEPILSTTVKVEFLCEDAQTTENPNELLPEYLEPGDDLWSYETSPKWDAGSRLLTISVQWILKCRCALVSSNPTLNTGEVILHRVHRTAAP